MRIGLLYPVFDPPCGGVENYFLEVGRHLAAAGHAPFVLAATSAERHPSPAESPPTASAGGSGTGRVVGICRHPADAVGGLSGVALPAGTATSPRDAPQLEVRRHPAFEAHGLARLRRIEMQREHVTRCVGQMAADAELLIARHPLYAVAAADALPQVPTVFLPADLWLVREQGQAEAGSRRDVLLTKWFAPAIRRIEREALGRAAAVMTLSRHFAERIAAFHDVQPDERWQVNPPGVDLRRFRPEPLDRGWLAAFGVPADAWVLLTVARIAAEKNLPHWIARFSQMDAAVSGRPVHLLLVGGGQGRDRLAALAARLGIADRVHLIGPRGDVDRFLRSADLAVCPSTSETFGQGVIEAMACGLPVLAYAPRPDGPMPIRTPAAEILSHGRTGLLADSRAPYSLADTAVLALGDGPLRQRLGRAARAVCQRRYTWPRHVETLLQAAGKLRVES